MVGGMERRVLLEGRSVAIPITALLALPNEDVTEGLLRAASAELDRDAYLRAEDLDLDRLLDRARVARWISAGYPEALAKWLVQEAHIQSALACVRPR